LELLLADPGSSHLPLQQAGSPWGWLALTLGALSLVWFLAVSRRELVGSGILVALAVGCMLAATASRWEGVPWFGYHVLLSAWLLIAALVLAVAWRWSDHLQQLPDAPVLSLARVQRLKGWVVGL